MLKTDTGSATERTGEASIWLVMLAPISFTINLLVILYLMR